MANILIVEDDPMNRDMIARHLKLYVSISYSNQSPRNWRSGIC
jgi:CheY-like chemotaxis protein